MTPIGTISTPSPRAQIKVLIEAVQPDSCDADAAPGFGRPKNWVRERLAGRSDPPSHSPIEPDAVEWRIPRRDVPNADRCFDQAPIFDPVLDLDTL